MSDTINTAWLLQQIDARQRRLGRPLVALDFGCGAGDLIAAGRRRGLTIWGTDNYHGRADYRADVLAVTNPNALPWIRETRPDGSLPFDDAAFDLIVSQEVIEHILDLDGTVREWSRILRSDGIGLHIFPTEEVIFEPHAGGLPFLHRLGRWLRLRRWAMWAWFRLGRTLHSDGLSFDAWHDGFTNYLATCVWYRSYDDIASIIGRYFTIEAIEQARLSDTLRMRGHQRLAHIATRMPQTVIETLQLWRGGTTLLIRPRSPR